MTLDDDPFDPSGRRLMAILAGIVVVASIGIALCGLLGWGLRP